MIASVIRPVDSDTLRSDYAGATPFPFFKIDDFLDEAFAKEVAAAYPKYETARTMGREFDKLNERLKVQITERSKFPEPLQRLADALASQEWLDALEYITGIPKLLADPVLAGGGMHITGSGGRLDVHVDFNYIPDRGLHRRLNILVYLNPAWDETWGGHIELWDKDVKRCHHSFMPVMNRCVVFETSEISYHGVTPVTAPPLLTRQSYAAYYYTKEAPVTWDGKRHSTVFRARPTERLRKYVMMPLASLRYQVYMQAQKIKGLLR